MCQARSKGRAGRSGHLLSQVRSIQKFFTHRPVSRFDRFPFQLTGELFLYGMDLVRIVVCSAFKPSPAGTLPRARGVDLLRAPRRIRTHPNASHGRERKDQPDGEP